VKDRKKIHLLMILLLVFSVGFFSPILIQAEGGGCCNICDPSTDPETCYCRIDIPPGWSCTMDDCNEGECTYGGTHLTRCCFPIDIQ